MSLSHVQAKFVCTVIYYLNLGICWGVHEVLGSVLLSIILLVNGNVFLSTSDKSGNSSSTDVTRGSTSHVIISSRTSTRVFKMTNTLRGVLYL